LRGRKKERNVYTSGRFKLKTPINKQGAGSNIATSISPEANVLDAALSGDGDRLVNSFENHGIPSFPDVPKDSRINSRVLATKTMLKEKVVEARWGQSGVVRQEGRPDFLGAGA
jgi:hypothetical protein